MSDSLVSEFREDANKFRNWCVRDALPLWADVGYDRARGGFYEKLDLVGSPMPDAIRRLRVQARQIYVYAHAAHLGWFPDGVEIALRGFAYLTDKGLSPDGLDGFVHLLKPDGSVENPLRDTYDHMFVILACAWLARVTGDSQIRGVAESTLNFVEDQLTDQHGDLLEGKPASLPRRQNPNMHAFELMLALHETLAWPGALERAKRIYQKLLNVFIDGDSGRLREYFGAQWERIDAPAGDMSEPGHMAEWAWLLHRYGLVTGEDLQGLPERFLHLAGLSRNETTMLLADECDMSGRLVRTTSRMWPQTEWLKGWLAIVENSGGGHIEIARDSFQSLWSRYLTGVPRGCWRDQLDAQGRMVSDHIPASSFYHIFVAAAELDRVSGLLSGDRQARSAAFAS